jgi:hypothetical protein
MSTDWLARVQETGRFGSVEWSQTETVDVSTLDALVAEFGVPSFTKIDVEGYEFEVLRGLTQALPALSLEFTPEHLEATERCVRRLDDLGRYAFNYSLGETFVFELPDWVDGERLLALLAAHAQDTSAFGDVYARLS